MIVANKTKRAQRARGATTREGVLEAALAVADDMGVHALTVRAVARHADTPPMSLYSHFSNRAELLDLMRAEVARRLFADSNRETWQAEMLGLCHQIRHILLQHPNWIQLFSRRKPHAPGLESERVLLLMTGEGMSSHNAVAILASARLLSIGLTSIELTFRDSFTMRFDQVKRRTEEAFADYYPVTRAAFAEVPHLDLSENFDHAARAFIAGVEATASRSRKSTA
mgnify:CR=1 FL=1